MNRPPSRKPTPEQQMLGAAVMIVFGVAWTVLAIMLTRSTPFPSATKVFPFIGVIFICFAIYHLSMTARERREQRLDPSAQGELRREERRARVNRLAGSVVAFLFMMGWTTLTRTFGGLLLGKLLMLAGLAGMAFTGHSIYRQIRAIMAGE